MVSLATTQADADGNYELEFDPTPSLERAAKNTGGVLNLSLHVLTEDNEFAVTNFSKRLDAGEWETDSVTSQPTVDAVLAQNPEGKVLNGKELDSATAAGIRGSFQPNPPSNCPLKSAVQMAVQVPILEAHNSPFSELDWEYSSVETTQVETAIKIGDNPWSVSGSYNVQEQNGTAIGGTLTEDVGVYIESQFTFMKWNYLETTPEVPECDLGADWSEITVNAWTGGSEQTPAPERTCSEDQNEYTANVPEGQYLRLDQTRAEQFSGAVEVSGASLGATTGYAPSAMMTWRAIDTDITLCGLHAYPGDTSEGPGLVWAGLPDCRPGDACLVKK